MELSRRQLPILFALAQAELLQAEGSVLPSHCYEFQNLPVKTDSKTGAQSRQVFRGTTHDGFAIDLHITTMPPGQMPHPPHHHPHEEIFFVQKGSLEATVQGKTTTVGPGSVIYIHSNDEHGVKAVGDVPAQYFVFALGSLTA
jgi:quercetin dioxygenase-like cupin family protein